MTEPMTDAELAKMSGRLDEYADEDVYSIFARDMRRVVAEVSEWRRVRIAYPADVPLPSDPDQYAAVPVFALEKRLAEIEAERDAERSRADAAEAERDAALARGAAEERARINRIAVQHHAMAVRDRDRAARSGNYVDAGRHDEQARGISPMIAETRPDLPIPPTED